MHINLRGFSEKTRLKRIQNEGQKASPEGKVNTWNAMPESRKKMIDIIQPSFAGFPVVRLSGFPIFYYRIKVYINNYFNTSIRRVDEKLPACN